MAEGKEKLFDRLYGKVEEKFIGLAATTRTQGDKRQREQMIRELGERAKYLVDTDRLRWLGYLLGVTKLDPTERLVTADAGRNIYLETNIWRWYQLPERRNSVTLGRAQDSNLHVDDNDSSIHNDELEILYEGDNITYFFPRKSEYDPQTYQSTIPHVCLSSQVGNISMDSQDNQTSLLLFKRLRADGTFIGWQYTFPSEQITTTTDNDFRTVEIQSDAGGKYAVTHQVLAGQRIVCASMLADSA